VKRCEFGARRGRPGPSRVCHGRGRVPNSHLFADHDCELAPFHAICTLKNSLPHTRALCNIVWPRGSISRRSPSRSRPELAPLHTLPHSLRHVEHFTTWYRVKRCKFGARCGRPGPSRVYHGRGRVPNSHLFADLVRELAPLHAICPNAHTFPHSLVPEGHLALVTGEVTSRTCTVSREMCTHAKFVAQFTTRFTEPVLGKMRSSRRPFLRFAAINWSRVRIKGLKKAVFCTLRHTRARVRHTQASGVHTLVSVRNTRTSVRHSIHRDISSW